MSRQVILASFMGRKTKHMLMGRQQTMCNESINGYSVIQTLDVPNKIKHPIIKQFFVTLCILHLEILTFTLYVNMLEYFFFRGKELHLTSTICLNIFISFDSFFSLISQDKEIIRIFCFLNSSLQSSQHLILFSHSSLLDKTSDKMEEWIGNGRLLLNYPDMMIPF